LRCPGELSKKEAQDNSELDDLCRNAGVEGHEFVGSIVGTSYELGIDVSCAIGGIVQMPQLLAAAIQQ
jgi:hypothetical protein